MRSFRDVVGATQPQYEYGMEDESAEVRGEVENLVDGSELGPLTQMLQDSHGTGGEGLNEVKREEGVGDKVGVKALGEGKGTSVEEELSEEGSQGGESGEEGSDGEGNRRGKGGGGKAREEREGEEVSKAEEQSYNDIGEDVMSRSHSSSGERLVRRVQTLSPSPRQLHGGGTGEGNESTGGLDSQVASSLISPGEVSKESGKG